MKDVLLENNIKLLFDGNDGDNVISHGYEELYYLLRKGNIYTFAKEVLSYARHQNIKFRRIFIIFLKEFLK